MTKRVFRSIFLASLAVLLATLALILGALYTYFSDVQAEQLRLQTALVAHALETEGVPILTAWTPPTAGSPGSPPTARCFMTAAPIPA